MFLFVLHRVQPWVWNKKQVGEDGRYRYHRSPHPLGLGIHTIANFKYMHSLLHPNQTRHIGDPNSNIQPNRIGPQSVIVRSVNIRKLKLDTSTLHMVNQNNTINQKTRPQNRVKTPAVRIQKQQQQQQQQQRPEQSHSIPSNLPSNLPSKLPTKLPAKQPRKKTHEQSSTPTSSHRRPLSGPPKKPPRGPPRSAKSVPPQSRSHSVQQRKPTRPPPTPPEKSNNNNNNSKQ